MTLLSKPTVLSGDPAPSIYPGPFLGRQTELGKLKKLIESNRIILIHGRPGIGKTRLALEYAREFGEDFADGVKWVNLSGISSMDRLVAAIAHASGLRFYEGQDHVGQLLAYLSGMDCIVVLDGVERSRDLTDLHNRFRQEVTGCRCLCTSTHTNFLDNVAALKLEGLQCEGATDPAPGTALLAAIAFDDSGNTTSGEHLPILERICDRLSGNPLALEMAGLLIRRQGLDESARELDEVVKGDSPLETLLCYLLESLDQRSSRALARLSVLESNFDRPAMEALVGDDGKTIDHLLKAALVREYSDGRFHLPDPVRQAAAKILTGSPNQEENAALTLSRFYMNWLKKLEPMLKGGKQREALERVLSDRANVRTAWIHAVRNRDFESIRMGIPSLSLFFDTMSWFQEGVKAFSTAVGALRAEKSVAYGSEEVEEVLAMAQTREGWFLYHLGKMEESREILERSLFILRHYGNLPEMALALNRLGVLAQYRGKLQEAAEYFEEALRTSLSIVDEAGQARALNNLGILAATRGEFGKAEEHLLAYREQSEKLGRLVDVSKAHHNLGLLCIKQGRLLDARRHLVENLQLKRTVGSLLGTANAVAMLGRLSYTLGRFEDALDMLEEAVRLRRRIGDRRRMIGSMENEGLALLRLGRESEAYRVVHESIESARCYGYALEEAGALATMAQIATVTGKLDEARSAASLALELSLQFETRPAILQCVLVTAEILAAREDYPEAAVLLLPAMSDPSFPGNLGRDARQILKRIRSELGEDELEKAGRTYGRMELEELVLRTRRALR
ncbi:tetratricopeptide repeat protein [Candidatus Fermentibacteria bacterium]|nr:tetratricopeptide repeat protein [Candidatus Fermentibacteria bacterium]